MLNIVIAEDDYRVAGIHEEFLAKVKGVQVIGKSLNGKETLELVENHQVDLVLLDIYMPDVLGTDLIHNIKENNPKTGIIMITAATEKNMVERSILNGVFDYIIKPVNIERFVTAIEKFKKTRTALETKKEFDQSFLDKYFGYTAMKTTTEQKTPKGIDPITLEKVRNILNETSKGITAEEMGDKMGASRTTARRYLEYLISVDEGKAELEYGIVGRPERKYYLYGKTS
ncbi:two-component system, CitB family, response regulator CitT [Salinibacillus kushneri]|uniref:Two-component system, CitB family, response regulator CitT n=1 Tax=Salinibacillus kushneri TaxID=237682 RepID=A0A1H9YYG6_9BACI|nr:response regulator [Salinibacillus kushneri]SES73748.1 two-component system, CitB family, response regulator CitT [Salinibacillus kushneri]